MKRAVFLDRDGTLNVRPAEHSYIRDVRDFVWLPGAADAVARLAQAGYSIAVVSNQRGVARGIVTQRTIHQIERRIVRDLGARGGRIDAFRYCFHDLSDACECRKPKPRMLVDLASELEVDLEQSWMIGDSDDDVLAGQAAGCRTVLVGSRPSTSTPDRVASNLDAASRLIVNTQRAASSADPA
jgi:D-glycero-D-manno-heptose 1,7-bisphosphate phosphatase